MSCYHPPPRHIILQCPLASLHIFIAFLSTYVPHHVPSYHFLMLRTRHCLQYRSLLLYPASMSNASLQRPILRCPCSHQQRSTHYALWRYTHRCPKRLCFISGNKVFRPLPPPLCPSSPVSFPAKLPGPCIPRTPCPAQTPPSKQKSITFQTAPAPYFYYKRKPSIFVHSPLLRSTQYNSILRPPTFSCSHHIIPDARPTPKSRQVYALSPLPRDIPTRNVVARAPHYDTNILAKRSPTSSFYFIIDSGTTMHMVPWQSCFSSYKALSGRYVRLADKTMAPIAGIGTISFTSSGHSVRVHQVLHVPNLNEGLYSCVQHQNLQGCSFHMENNVSTLCFPSFVITSPVSGESKVYCQPTTSLEHADFDSSKCPTINSYNACLKATAKARSIGSDSAWQLTPHLGWLAATMTMNLANNPQEDVSSVQMVTQSQDSDTQSHTYIPPPSPVNIPPDPSPSPPSNPHDDMPPAITPTYAIPSSSPETLRLYLDELLMSLGFRSVDDFFRVLPHIAQPNLTISKSIDSFPQLGSVATIERRRRNTSLLPLPNSFLDTVHYDIAYGKRCALGGGAKYVLLLVDLATRQKMSTASRISPQTSNVLYNNSLLTVGGKHLGAS